MIKVLWIDEEGQEVVTKCFNEAHALRLEEILDASGLPHERMDVR